MYHRRPPSSYTHILYVSSPPEQPITFNTKRPIIFQTWHTTYPPSSLPPKMRETVNQIIAANPECDHQLFNDTECRNFIRDNFPQQVLTAYDTLIPTAFKADLWRYCILYKHGGIYLDIKYKPVNNFKFIDLFKKVTVLTREEVINRQSIQSIQSIQSRQPVQSRQSNDEFEYIIPEMFVLERNIPNFWCPGTFGIHNALIISPPNTPILRKCIEQIVYNVTNRLKYPFHEDPATHYFPTTPLFITGPGLLGTIFHKEKVRSVPTQQSQMSYETLKPHFCLFFDTEDDIPFIQISTSTNNTTTTTTTMTTTTTTKRILEMYNEYRSEQYVYRNKEGTDHYTILWNRGIYATE